MFGIKKSFFMVLALAFVVSGDIASKDTTNTVKETVNQLQGELDQMSIPPELQNIMGLPGINEGEDMLRERCLKNGNNESFDRAMEARTQFGECVSGLVDGKQLQKEINAAKPTGDLDTVFKKYCRKTPIVKGCLQALLKGIDSCFAENEKSQFTTLEGVTDSLMNFVCYKEGDRIALFIAEGGPECLTSKMDSVQNCINSTVQNAQSGAQGNLTTEDIPDIVIDAEKCGYFTQVQKCVVQVLEDCSEPTPANIVGSLFDFVRKSTPCIEYYKSTTGGSNSLVFSVMSILLPIGAIILSKI